MDIWFVLYFSKKKHHNNYTITVVNKWNGELLVNYTYELTLLLRVIWGKNTEIREGGIFPQNGHRASLEENIQFNGAIFYHY